MVAVPLPDLDSLDVEALKALAITQHGELNKQREALAEQRQILAEQSQTLAERIKELRSGNERIEHLKLVIEKLRSRMFGAKSEKIVVRLEQLELHLEELESWQAEMEAAVETVSPAAEPKTRSPRKPLPEQLTRKVIPHLPQGDCCPDCGGQLRPFGEDVAELLEYVPESFKGIHHVRPKFACAACERVVDPPAPARPIERGLPGPGLLAHVPVSKFCGHLPLYCQPEIYAREGVDLDRSTLAGWVGAASELLTPLVDEIRKHVLAASKIHADDTPVPVLAPGNGKTKTGRLWTYVRDDRPAGENRTGRVVRLLRRSQGRTSAQQHLKDFKGALQADAYAGLSSSVRCAARSMKLLAGRMRGASSTRSMRRIHASPTTTEALERIGALYGIEDQIFAASLPICGGSSPDASQTAARRVAKMDGKIAAPTLAEERNRGCDPLRALALARPHALRRRWTAGDRQQRGRTCAARRGSWRKNYLFAGSDAGGDRAAAIYSAYWLGQAQRPRSGTLPPHRASPDCQGRSKSRPLGRSKREPVEDREGVFRGRRGAGA
jgi:transposase